MGQQDTRRSAGRVECDLSEETKKFLTSLAKPTIGETSIAQRLDAIIAMQEQFGIRLGLLETRAENIHGLLFDLVTSLTTDPEKITELAAKVKSVREKLQTSVDNQKGD